MSIVVKRKSGSNLSTISSNRQYRVNRLKGDLDKSFIEQSTKSQAVQSDLPFIDLYGFPIDTSIIKMIPKEKVISSRMGVFAIGNKQLYMATDTPGYLEQSVIIQDLETKGYTCKLYLCSSLSLQKLIKTFDHLIEPGEVIDSISINESEILRIQALASNLKTLASYLPKASTSEFINITLTAAILQGATDIHFEPEEYKYNIRLRLDGILINFTSLDREIQGRIESRIKILAGVKLNLDTSAQDGRFSFVYQGKEMDVRTSFLPSNYGYSIVMRLLGSLNVEMNLDALGFVNAQSRIGITKAMDAPQGLILTTGPTGSGKTTTLYTLLTKLNDGTTKIITLEDPIEYKLEGISQTQIDPAVGYTFASGLKSILRQDPDIVMVGEIRDNETAEIAIQAALTGHQVLSTIHTNDAAGAIPRLLELGVHGYAIADSISVIIGQRLVRKLCKFCQAPDTLTDEQKLLVTQQLNKMPLQARETIDFSKFVFNTGTGCEKCNNLGYKGRIGVYELLTITDTIRGVISNQFPSTVQMREMAVADGMITMIQDGFIKAGMGITDVKEVLRNIMIN